jgi:hypothetical protein
MMLLGGGDWDLVVDTKNLFGPQTVTRLFYAAAGATSVSLRYRFQTDEIWSAYPQTGQYQNDWFTVTLRNQRTNQASTTTQSVSSLSAQFDGNAATPWFTLALPIAAAGDPMEVTLTVANAVDNAYLSILYADIVSEQKTEIARLELNDQHLRSNQIQKLSYLSASPHDSYDGKTRIFGTISITAPPQARLQALWLDVLEHGQPKARASLASSAAAVLLNQPFSSGQLTVSTSQLLFELPSSEAAKLEQYSDDSRLQLRVGGTFVGGTELAGFVLRRNIVKLVRYLRSNRVPPGDLGNCENIPAIDPKGRPAWNAPFPCGGDAWALPKTVQLAGFLSWPSVAWGDFSNMNGGIFPPHSGHQDGRTIDGEFDGYKNRDSAAADKLLNFVVFPFYDHVERVLVAYRRVESNSFWRFIRDKKLPDGRCAKDVIKPEGTHRRHFDIKFGTPPPPPYPASCWP